MVIFDQLKKSDPRLRAMWVLVAVGLFVLLCGLWWVQIVSARDYRAHVETQAFRTVRLPAVRGKILDRDGKVLAENRPVYNVCLYLEELRKSFEKAADAEKARARTDLKQQIAREEQELHRKLKKDEAKRFTLSLKQIEALRLKARYQVASNVVAQISERLGQPLWLNPTNFERHFQGSLALPFPVATNLDDAQIARFEEQNTSATGVDLEMQSVRVYPGQTTAAHVLGSLKRANDSTEGELATFSYRLPDFRGQVGVEYACDKELRGKAGAKTVLVNNAGYRQTENVWTPAEPGANVVLTLDLYIQKKVEEALPMHGAATRGAVVVMDVTNGDVLAMASCPTYNPNSYIQRWADAAERQRVFENGAEKNRATQERYAPGSTFKPVVALAALERGLDPNATYTVPPDPERAGRGCYYVNGRRRQDQAPPGIYDLRLALIKSSNGYFVTNGIRAGISHIVDLGKRLHFGEPTGLNTRQETAGEFPSLQTVSSAWRDSQTANVCIGQDPILVTPLQMAVMISAIANGGTVFWPRLVQRIEPQEPAAVTGPEHLPGARVRDHLNVSERSLVILRKDMRDDVEANDGTGKEARVEGLQICGKTGTAQIQDERGKTTDHTTWFISFAPFEKPRYAVVVMVESGVSGGVTCAPIAKKVYAAILERERMGTSGAQPLATTN